MIKYETFFLRTCFLQVQVCKDNWWRNLLYINNFIDGPGYLDTDAMCLGQTWYLSTEMQMFLFTPLLLLPMYWVEQWKGIVWSLLPGVTFVILNTVEIAALAAIGEWPMSLTNQL